MAARKPRGKGGNVAAPAAADAGQAKALRQLVRIKAVLPMTHETEAEFIAQPTPWMGAPQPTPSETTLTQLVARARALSAHVPDSVQELVAQDEALRLARRKRAPGAGRPVTLTQYDRHDARIESLRQAIATHHHVHEVLPGGLRRGSGIVEAYPEIAAEFKRLRDDPKIPRHKILSELRHRMELAGVPVPDPSNLRKGLSRLELWPLPK